MGTILPDRDIEKLRGFQVAARDHAWVVLGFTEADKPILVAGPIDFLDAQRIRQTCRRIREQFLASEDA